MCLMSPYTPALLPPLPSSAMEFIVALLRRVHDDPAAALGTAVDETYRSTLMQFHGFFVSSAFTVGCGDEPAARAMHGCVREHGQ